MTIDTANITDAIALLGTVGTAFVNVAKVIIVDNLSTILVIAVVLVVLGIFSGLGAVVVKFMHKLLGSYGRE